MSVPFRFKQSYRDLFEFLGNNKDVTRDTLDAFASLLDPLFPEETTTKFLEMCPIGVDKFMTFIAEGQAHVAINYDVILWNYVAKMAQYNLFKGEKECPLKELRSFVDPSLKLHCKEPELTNLYKKHCNAFAQGGDPSEANIASTELSTMWKELSSSTPLSDLLRALMPKVKGGKSTAVAPPERKTEERSPSPKSPTVSKTSPTSQPPAASTSPTSPTPPQRNQESPLPPPPPAPPVPVIPKAAEEKPEEVVVSVVPTPQVLEEIPPPPPRELSPVQPAKEDSLHPVHQQVVSRTVSAVVEPQPPANDPKGAQTKNSANQGKELGSPGKIQQVSITATSSPSTTGRTSPVSAAQTSRPPTVDASSTHGSYTDKMLQLLARGGAVDGGLVNNQGGVVDAPALPLEVIEFLGGLEKQRCELQEQLQHEIDEIHDCNSAIEAMKRRRDNLVKANAAYFALRGADEDGKDLVTGQDISQRIVDPNAPSALHHGAPSSPFARIAGDRQQLLVKMDQWLQRARDENDFLRKEVALARQAMHYDETSAVVGEMLSGRNAGGGYRRTNSSDYSDSAPVSRRSTSVPHRRHHHDRAVNENTADDELVLPHPEVMTSPYRVARFYAKMAKKDKELRGGSQLNSHPHAGPPHHEASPDVYPVNEQVEENGFPSNERHQGGYPFKGQQVPEHLFYMHYYDEVPELAEQRRQPPPRGRTPPTHPSQAKSSAAAKYWASTTAGMGSASQSLYGINDRSTFVQRRPPQQQHVDPYYAQPPMRRSSGGGAGGSASTITKGLEQYFASQHRGAGAMSRY